MFLAFVQPSPISRLGFVMVKESPGLPHTLISCICRADRVGRGKWSVHFRTRAGIGMPWRMELYGYGLGLSQQRGRRHMGNPLHSSVRRIEVNCTFAPL